MQARVLFLSDLHKRDTDFTTINGYTKAIDAVQNDILNFIHQNGVTHLISLGDWYDKGYRSVRRTFNDAYWDMQLSNAVNGNFYICRGNHLYIERDSNPEMYLIQPCEAMPLSESIKTPETPIIKSPDYIVINGIQISLFHFTKDNKLYVRSLDTAAKFHIGVYHDDCVVPSSVRAASGDMGKTLAVSNERYFANVDVAIVGHIHMPIGKIDINLHNKRVPMFIPGSLCITKNKATEIHQEVGLPFITVNDDGSFKFQLANFSLHTELLHLYTKTEAKTFDAITNNQNTVRDIKEMSSNLTLSSDDTLVSTLISMGFNDKHLQVVQRASTVGLTADEAVLILGGD